MISCQRQRSKRNYSNTGDVVAPASAEQMLRGICTERNAVSHLGAVLRRRTSYGRARVVEMGCRAPKLISSNLKPWHNYHLVGNILYVNWLLLLFFIYNV